jgi:hypothetical protein
MIPPPAQQMMANRAAPHVTEVSGRYAIYVSNPEVVAAVIRASRRVQTIAWTVNPQRTIEILYYPIRERSGDAPAVERKGCDCRRRTYDSERIASPSTADDTTSRNFALLTINLTVISLGFPQGEGETSRLAKTNSFLRGIAIQVIHAYACFFSGPIHFRIYAGQFVSIMLFASRCARNFTASRFISVRSLRSRAMRSSPFFQMNNSLQLRYVSYLDSTRQGEDHALGFGRSLNPEGHLCLRVGAVDAKRWPTLKHGKE